MNIPQTFTLTPVAGLALALLALPGCGPSPDSAQATTTEQDTQTQGNPTAEPAERAIGNLEAWIDLFDGVNDALIKIDSRDAANEHADWLNEDFIPRLDELTDEMVVFIESMGDAEVEALHAAFAIPANEQRMDQLVGRMDRVLNQLDENIVRVESSYGTPALEAAWLNLAQANERLESRMAATFAGGETVIGSPAWCQAMANKPQAQWSMNDAFAFANHCVGGR